MGTQLSSAAFLRATSATAMLLLFVSSASAEGNTGPKIRSSLSQIDFDEGFVPSYKLTPSIPAAPTAATSPAAAPGAVVPAIIQQSTPPVKAIEVKEASKEKPTTTKLAKKGKANAADARAMLGGIKLSEEKLENQIIVPRLRGPFTDRGDTKSIKSVLSWKAKKSGACAQPQNGAELCNKARALKETLFRFSGNHDFFDSQCNASCATPEEVSVPQGLNIPEASDTKFKLVSESNSCRYQLQKSGDGNWMVMSPSKLTCVCLPKSCFAE